MLCEVSAGVEGGVRGRGFEVGGQEGEGLGGGDGGAGVVDGGWVGGGHYEILSVLAGYVKSHRLWRMEKKLKRIHQLAMIFFGRRAWRPKVIGSHPV